MSPPTTLTRQSPLFAELRRFILLRWYAGVMVLLGGVGYYSWYGEPETSTLIVGVGTVILAYNLILWIMIWRYQGEESAPVSLPIQAWLQIALDLVCLTVLVVLTDGALSPLLGLFVLHMVFASLLLSPQPSFLCAALAIGLVTGALALTNQWPEGLAEANILIGWGVTLVTTVFLTNHITRGLRRQESHIREQHQYIKAILDTAADGIVTIDDRGTVVAVNHAAQVIFGYEAYEILGQNVTILMPEPFRGEHDRYIAEYLRTGESGIIGKGREVTGLRKDGTTFPLDAAVSEVPLQGRTNFTGIVRDITDRKAAEDDLRRLNETLRHQQRALVQGEKMAAMGQMAAGVAHEISNPLASMDSLLQLALRDPQRMNEATVGTLREQVERIRRIVLQMTNFAHPNEGGWEAIELNTLVEGVLDMVRFDHRLREVEIVRELSEDVGKINLIRQAMEQVIVNMILNALDALEEVESPRLRVVTRRAADGMEMEIQDNGSGIPAEDLNRIFEPFFTTKPVGKGTGLGLSISYSLIRQQGGRIRVESEPGSGTTFTIELPGAMPSSNREAHRGDIPDSEKTQN